MGRTCGTCGKRECVNDYVCEICLRREMDISIPQMNVLAKMDTVPIVIDRHYERFPVVRGQGTYPHRGPSGAWTIFVSRMPEDRAKAMLEVDRDVRWWFDNKLYVEFRYDKDANRTYAIYNHDGRFSILSRRGKPKEVRW